MLFQIRRPYRLTRSRIGFPRRVFLRNRRPNEDSVFDGIGKSCLVSPSSASEQNMPSLSTPLILPVRISPPTTTEQSKATGTKSVAEHSARRLRFEQARLNRRRRRKPTDDRNPGVCPMTKLGQPRCFGVPILCFIAFNLRAAHRHGVGKFFVPNGDADIVVKPLFR